jgi:hypothetical protein
MMRGSQKRSGGYPQLAQNLEDKLDDPDFSGELQTLLIGFGNIPVGTLTFPDGFGWLSGFGHGLATDRRVCALVCAWV